MRHAAFVFGARFRPARSAMGRDFAEALPSATFTPMLAVAATVTAIFALLDLVHYWPR